jgi:hypothetical protein
MFLDKKKKRETNKSKILKEDGEINKIISQYSNENIKNKSISIVESNLKKKIEKPPKVNEQEVN